MTTLVRASAAVANTFTVTNTNDSGSGSLRQAILNANANPGLDAINFSIGSGAKTITPLSALPTSTGPVQIFGITQPGFSGTPLIEIKGSSAGASADGLRITAGGSIVVGLSIDGFSGDGIELSGGGGNQIANSRLGTTGSGAGLANGGAGVHVVNSPNNTIDGRFCIFTCSPEYNVIVRNTGPGIRIEGSSSTGNVVTHNIIGFQSIGGSALPNGNGVDLALSASGDRIGGTASGDRNVISGNTGANVLMETGATTNLVEGNYVGTDFFGGSALGGSEGVFIFGSTNNTIGGTAPAARNVISGNTVAGVWITPASASGNQVLGNFIGTDASGGTAIPNPVGVLIESASNTVGGAASGAANVISGNGGAGVQLRGTAATTNQIVGNRIGTNAAGTAALGNSTGVLIIDGATNTTVGGSAPGAGNVISGNISNGVVLLRTSADQLLGNLIGTDASGTADLGNGGFGVLVQDTASNVIGGTTAGARNVISGNNGEGVLLIHVDQATNNNLLQGNFIGTNATGTAALPNRDGVEIDSAGGNTIGGTGAGAGNVISGNLQMGLSLVNPAATTNRVVGNLIGTNAGGTAAVPNGFGGVLISNAPTNTIGGAEAGARNVISGNNGDGVQISGDGASGNVLAGNFVGTDGTGMSSIPNNNGVSVDASNNTIGGTTAGAGNVISGNNSSGIAIFQVTSTNPPTGNLVQGNLIGTNAGGSGPLGNVGNGVFLFEATNNVVGGTTAAARNVISANSRGVLIGGATTTGNEVLGNFIGTDVSGTITAGFGNAGPGVRIEDAAPGTVIGGTAKGAGNLLSGNGGEGVDIEGGTKAQVDGNLIGTDVTGTIALGNAEDGVIINNGTSNTIGGKGAALNVISGNDGNGVQIVGPAATSNKILGNRIGTKSNGTAALANALDGVLVDGAPSNTIGSTKASLRNVISANTENGVEITAPAAKSNKVLGNFIGTQKDGASDLGNGSNGVLVTSSAKKNKIGGTAAGSGNTIGFNGGAGVFVASGTGDAIRENSIFSNTGLGIDLDPTGVNPNDPGDGDGGANLGQNYPVLTSASSGPSSTTIVGTLNSTPSTTGFSLEFYSSPTCDLSGFGEGKTFLGFLAPVDTDAGGNAAFTVTLPVSVPAGSSITSTATDPASNTSEFSHCIQSS